MKTIKLLTSSCLFLGMCTPALATSITFDFEDNVTVTPNAGFSNTITQDVGDFQVSFNFGNYSGPTADNDNIFIFSGGLFNFGIQVRDTTTATATMPGTVIPFSVESVTVGNVNNLSAVNLIGLESGVEVLNTPLSFAGADPNGVVAASTTASGDPIPDVDVSFLTVQFVSDAGTGVSIDDLVISVPPVPEPTSFVLLGLASAGALVRRRR